MDPVGLEVYLPNFDPLYLDSVLELQVNPTGQLKTNIMFFCYAGKFPERS